MIHLEIVGVQVGLNIRRRRGLGLRIRLAFIATGQERCKRQTQSSCGIFNLLLLHWITSRPTAWFNCAAAVKYEPTRFT